MLPDFSAVILDMDGLVLDTETTYRFAWQRAAEDLGHQLSDGFLLSLTGLHYERVEARLLDTCDKDLKIDQFRILSSTHWHQHIQEQGIPVKTGFFELLSVINSLEVPYCLATNSLRANAEECLSIAGVRDCFSILVCRDQVVNAKPAPDIFLKAAEALNVRINECLIVEDSMTGIEAALDSGGIPVLIPGMEMPNQYFQLHGVTLMKDLAELAGMISLQADKK